MDRIDAMRCFLAVVDRGGFAAAARALRLSPAAATRAVAMLEQELGLPLLARTTRALRLTDRGALYAEGCRRLIADLDDLTGRTRGEDAAPRGLLSVTAPLVFGRLHVLPIVETLLDRHAGLQIRLTLLDRPTHLVEEGFDLAVRIGVPVDSSLIGRPVAAVRRVVVASPDYLERAGVPATPAALKDHRIIGFEGMGSTNVWPFGTDGRTSVTVAPRLSVTSADAAIEAAVRGQGVTRVLSYQSDRAVADGRLTRILADHEPAAVPVTLLTPAARRNAPQVAAFFEAAQAYFATPRWAQ